MFFEKAKNTSKSLERDGAENLAVMETVGFREF